jgi:hypothetical protein
LTTPLADTCSPRLAVYTSAGNLPGSKGGRIEGYDLATGHTKILATTDRTAMAEKVGMSESAIKVATHRLRRRYRELLRVNVSHTLAHPTEVAVSNWLSGTLALT